MSKHIIENSKFALTVDYDRIEDRAVVRIKDKRSNESGVLRGFSGITAQANALKFARNFFDDPADQPRPARSV